MSPTQTAQQSLFDSGILDACVVSDTAYQAGAPDPDATRGSGITDTCACAAAQAHTQANPHTQVNLQGTSVRRVARRTVTRTRNAPRFGHGPAGSQHSPHLAAAQRLARDIRKSRQSLDLRKATARALCSELLAFLDEPTPPVDPDLCAHT